MVQQLGRVLPILVEALQSCLNLIKGSDQPAARVRYRLHDATGERAEMPF